MSAITKTRQVGGQVELADPASVADSRYANPELLPVPLSKRTWSTYNYIAIWMGMAPREQDDLVPDVGLG